jgi:hypothetical protein
MTKSPKPHALKMVRSAEKVSKVTARSTSKAASSKGSKVLGTTFDGVQILKPKGKATHFTTGELRRAIANARATRSGR